MNVIDLVQQEWPTTVFAWYGDSGFANSLLLELGWNVRTETTVTDLDQVVQLFENISDTLLHTIHTDRLLLRSANRWNLLLWRNDEGGALSHLNHMPLAMPVYEFTFINSGVNVNAVVGLGTERRVLAAVNGVVDKAETQGSNPGVSSEDCKGIEEGGQITGLAWHLKLTNSFGLPATKILRVHTDLQKTLLDMGAQRSLFELTSGWSGKVSLLDIDDSE